MRGVLPFVMDAFEWLRQPFRVKCYFEFDLNFGTSPKKGNNFFTMRMG